MTKLNFFTIAPDPGGIRALLYGTSGAGKTTIATAIGGRDDFCPALLVDVDKGLRSITHVNYGSDIVGLSISSVFDLRTVLEQLLLAEDKRMPEMRGIKTIIIDSLSQLRDDTMQEIRTNEFNRSRRGDAFTTQIQDYNKTMVILDTTLAQIRATGVNIILTAEEDVQKDGLGVISSRHPDLFPRLRRAVHHKVDYIWPVIKHDGQVGIRVVTPKNVPCDHLVKSRGPIFEQALLEDEHVNDKGYFMIPDHTFQVIPYLNDLYLSSMEEK